jgi:hypothetical protein
MPATSAVNAAEGGEDADTTTAVVGAAADRASSGSACSGNVDDRVVLSTAGPAGDRRVGATSQ